jgi:hypothetical protein
MEDTGNKESIQIIQIIKHCLIYFQIILNKDESITFYLSRWDVRLELFWQFKSELVRLLEGLVFEKKYF